MNEGKPAKPKWWSLPRRQDSVGEAEGVPSAGGDYELSGPEAAGSGRVPLPDGDFELARPAGAGGEAVSGAEAVPAGEAPSGGAAVAALPDGDFELRRPEDAAEATDAADVTDVADVSEAPVTAPAVERPGPLHDPDPYSTPPYGEPGPWAPAPPVQHPAAGTPAQGTATPAPPPASVLPTPVPVPPQSHGAPAPAPAPIPAPAPVPPQTHTLPAPEAPAPASPAAAHPATPWHTYDPWSSTPLQLHGAAVEDKDTRRRRVRRALVTGAVALALVSGGVGGVLGAYLERNGGVGAVELPQAGKEPAGRAPDSVAGIAARALPSVVTLHVSGAAESGTGTGFVLDAQGHILTNNHVVEPAAGSSGQISVTFNSGDTAKATVVGRDSGYDLAVVKVSNVRGLKPMPLGNSDNVQVGDPVVAIGAPFDLEGTVTSGIISAKERPITAGGNSSDGSDVSYVDALQTDAPINPGNSGGPLLDTRARVIGINSAIRSADDGSDSGGGQAGSIGLGFAIPVNQAKRVAEELINTGKATHPVIGVTLDMDYTGDGARVGAKAESGGPAVTRGGPGDTAGIKAGDVITAVDGQRVHSGEELIVKTRAHRPGDRLVLTVRRDGKERKISLVLGSSEGR
ncbi:trypsin-like peptidase domain-containing protein [Streptomyces sp. NPDC057616]|uniref:S1C family serine protease n=1 Tax=Streptomyces sp. NPDC057616 TaxID=3346183 RepID=UPI0036ABE9D9